jgi:hypothetical protein
VIAARARPSRTLAICAAGLVLATHTVDSQGLARYRNVELGSNLASISSLTAVALSEAKTIHQRPAVLQDLEWRLSQSSAGSLAGSMDPVEQIVFSFCNDRLFRVVVDYEHNRTAGLTNADLIEALSAVYGAPATRAVPPARMTSEVEAASGSPVARWRDAGHTVVLYRTSKYLGEFRLIVTDTALNALAQKATIQAERLDAQEAPRREPSRLKREEDDGRATAEKARIANKKAFRP